MKKKIIPHKKGDFAGMTVIPFCGYCKSYFSEDGYHEEGTYKVVKPSLGRDNEPAS